MKNNTLAIALAALLVGGVATAGYMNNRDNARSSNAPQAVAAAQPADISSEPLPMDGAIPASAAVPPSAGVPTPKTATLAIPWLSPAPWKRLGCAQVHRQNWRLSQPALSASVKAYLN